MMTTIENRGGVLLAGGSYVASEIKHAQKHVTGYSEDAFLKVTNQSRLVY
jgi:hypothetical protein